MLKFSDYLFESEGLPHRDTKTADAMAARGITNSPSTPTSDTIVKKPRTLEECGEFVKKLVSGAKKKSSNIDNDTPEYNGVYITAKSHFIVTGENEYQYELAYANSFINDVPYFHVSGVGTPVDQRVQEKSSKDKSIIVPDKYFPNVKSLFNIIREWQRSLSLTKQNANKTYSYEDFLMEISTTVPQTNPSTSINSSLKNPMPVEGFLNMNLHRMTEEQTFGNFNDYKEVLATVEMLLGNQAKNMKPIIKDMSIRNFLTLENNFKKASEVQRPLWFLKIKTVETNGEQIFTEVKFKRLIKHGSEIKIINKTTKTEIEVQISKIEYVKKKEGQF